MNNWFEELPSKKEREMIDDILNLLEQGILTIAVQPIVDTDQPLYTTVVKNRDAKPNDNSVQV